MRCMLQMMTPSLEAAGTEPGAMTRVYEAGAVRYTETAPPRDLAADVVCFWTLRVDPTGEGYRHHVLPDLTVDVLSVNGSRALVMGPPTAARQLALPAGISIEGARLHPGAARHVLDCAPAELLDRKVALYDVLRAPLDLAEQLSRRSLHAIVPELLRRGAANGDRSTDGTVRSAIAWLGTNARSSIDDLSRQVNWSDRKLRRRFVDAVGMGPKLVQRIVRVQRALHVLRARTGHVSLSGLAVECGFADQAHMTREVAHFTDYTPNRLRTLAHPSELAAADYA
ncbi:MAG TPA: helix-turn-helix transcriptional regulator [Gammaproteobacteria bacterium]|nr:helix-turn-helix transcriptional regulator [Gammaproteobacteria bacterium]